MSSIQQPHTETIHFNSADNGDVLDKPNSGIVQKMVMSETASASLIATAVAKLTTSSVTPSNAPNKSESDSITESTDPKFDNVAVTTTQILTTDQQQQQQLNENQSSDNALPNETVAVVLVNKEQVIGRHTFYLPTLPNILMTSYYFSNSIYQFFFVHKICMKKREKERKERMCTNIVDTLIFL